MQSFSISEIFTMNLDAEIMVESTLTWTSFKANKEHIRYRSCRRHWKPQIKNKLQHGEKVSKAGCGAREPTETAGVLSCHLPYMALPREMPERNRVIPTEVMKSQGSLIGWNPKMLDLRLRVRRCFTWEWNVNNYFFPVIHLFLGNWRLHRTWLRSKLWWCRPLKESHWLGYSIF